MLLFFFFIFVKKLYGRTHIKNRVEPRVEPLEACFVLWAAPVLT